MAKTDLPLFLINLLKHKNSHNFVDKDVEEYAVQILTLLLA